VQYNNSGTLAGSANLTFDGTTLTANALTTTSTVTINGGTANGVAYLNGSKVLTTGSALVFDGVNLGMGITPSAWYSSWKALEVGNGAIATAGTVDFRLYSNAYKNTSAVDTYKGTGSASYYVQNNGIHYWGIAPSGTAGNAITFTQAMTLDASSNLLVGTTTTPNAYFYCKSNFIGLQTSNPLDSSKWRQMVFANNSTDANLYFPNGTNTPLLSSAGSWTNASDSRQKTNITAIKYGLAAVLSSQPRSYNRTDVAGDFFGFVAQELKTLIPEVVFGSEETSYSVDYGSLVAVAFKAIQELSAQVTTLQTQVTALKG
jgi:hypothetical protein